MDSRQGFLLSRLPALFFEVGPLDLLWWQWGALILVAVLAVLLGWLLGRLSRSLLTRLASRTAVTWDDVLAPKLAAPLRAAWTLLVFWLLLPSLCLKTSAESFLRGLLRGGLLVILFWALARGVDVARQAVAQSEWAKAHPASRSLVPIGARVAQVTIVAFAVVALLHELGYPVASLIAGLGIGGLALALAAQKTVENLFGAFSIGADQPFREGDFVRVDDFVGTVESIGLRSTRFRTLDRTVISLPNGKLAEMRLETFAVRDRIRLSCNLPLVFSTTAVQVRQVLQELERVLRQHPKIWSNDVGVCLREIAESALVIEVMAWFTTADWNEFVGIRQELLLQFLEVVERAGTSLAYPTRAVHLVTPPVSPRG